MLCLINKSKQLKSVQIRHNNSGLLINIYHNAHSHCTLKYMDTLSYIHPVSQISTHRSSHAVFKNILVRGKRHEFNLHIYIISHCKLPTLTVLKISRVRYLRVDILGNQISFVVMHETPINV